MPTYRHGGSSKIVRGPLEPSEARPLPAGSQGGGRSPRNLFRFSCLNGENLATVSIYLSKRSTDVRLKKQFTALIAVPQTYLPGRKTTCDSRSI